MHIVKIVVKYSSFRKILVTLFGRFEFENQFRKNLRTLHQFGAKSVSVYAANKFEALFARILHNFTNAQILVAVTHFVFGFADKTVCEYLQQNRSRRLIEWQQAI